MAISPGFIAAQPINQNYEVFIEFLAEPPPSDLSLDTPRAPGQLIGFYDTIYEIVQLYIVTAGGLKLARVS